MSETKHILMAHGGGGELMRQLIDEHVLPRLGNDALNPLGDSACLDAPSGRLCMTTDAYVVQPITFPGGSIGDLAVAGTVNDLAVAGAEPIALSLAMVLEEGLLLATLDRVLDDVAAMAGRAGVRVVTGDTKVIERRGSAEPGLTLTTAGLGVRREDANPDPARIEPGDAVLVNGLLGEHGLAVMSAREGLAFQTTLRSDVAPLNGLIAALLDSRADVKFLRDATRGGLAGVLADLTEATGLTLEVPQRDLPIPPSVRSAADLLGLDPLNIANEGKVVAVVARPDADRALQALQRDPLGSSACQIGTFTDATPPLVELLTRAGGRRVVTRPYGEDLPRIC
jgi:hydrogenase expression/formation protein HypE